MAISFLLLLLGCLCVATVKPSFGETRARPERSADDDGTAEEVVIEFAVRRPGSVDAERLGVQMEQDDSFCDKGVDFPGNITLHTFYRYRDETRVEGDWTFLQKNSARIG